MGRMWWKRYWAFSAVFILQSSLAQQIEKEFTWRPNPSEGPTRISDGWTDRSLISCVASCMTKYPVSCQSVMYNGVTGLCTAGQWTTSSEPLPSTAEGELYTTSLCNRTPGFELYTYNNTGACVFHNGQRINYTGALAVCHGRDSQLYTSKNMDKFRILQGIVETIGSPAWVGLTDIEEEDTFIWSDDGTEIDPLMRLEMFRQGEPNNHEGAEHCVVMSGGSKMLNDDSCDTIFMVICEKQM